MIDLAISSDPIVRGLLAQHPRVLRIEEGECKGVQFHQGDWSREVCIGDVSKELYGLVEIIDNNPLVCADILSIPSPSATMALIAIAPLSLAGAIEESPIMVTSIEVDESEIHTALEREGWADGIGLHTESVNLDGVVATTVMVAVSSEIPLEEIRALYAERYERSFFIQSSVGPEWSPDLVSGSPSAIYRLSIAQDSPTSLLTIRLLADRNGKCGAGQVIHAMNVMCGFEESLGVVGDAR